MTWENDMHAGQLALMRGLYAEADRLLSRALETASAFGPGDPAFAEVQKSLAKVYIAAGKPKEAENAAREALASDEMYFGSECEQVAEDCFLLGEALRLQWDFERARPWFERALIFRERHAGTTHATTLEVLSRLVVVHLQARQSFGLDKVHAKAYEAFQTTHPSGMWATFLKLHELTPQYLEADRVDELRQLLRTEANLLRQQAGKCHKEVAGVLALEAALLKQSGHSLAAGFVGSKVQHVEKANDLSLFASDERTYKMPVNQAEDTISKLLGGMGRWVFNARQSAQSPIVATKHYDDGEAVAELRLTVRSSPRGPLCTINYHWQLFNSSKMPLAKAIIAETIKELDDNLNVIKASINLSANFAMPPGQASHDAWPTPQQFNEAIQNPRTSFSDAQLQASRPEENVLGLPKPYSGAFATVYKLSTDSKDVAVKCFTTKVVDQQTRYAAIAAALSGLGLPYFVQFEYHQNGVTVGASKYPILKMEWVHGQPLIGYIHENLRNRQRLDDLALNFLKMVSSMQTVGLAHGDLQHGNIIIVDDQLQLVDYDGMFVPQLAGLLSNELGHRNYQHPLRKAETFDARLDNFSLWVIYCSLICLSRAPQLWDLLEAGEESLLFKQADYANPDASKAFRLLLGESDPDIKSTIRFFRQVVDQTPGMVPNVVDVFGVSGS